MKLRFYPYDFDYKRQQDKTIAYLYGKQENGTKVCVLHAHEPFFYAKVHDADKAVVEKKLKQLSIAGGNEEPARIIRWEEVEKELVGKKQTFWKIFVNYPKAVPLIAEELQSWGLACYEKDILFVHRYLRDTGILPATLVEAEGDFADEPSLRVPAFRAEKIRSISPDLLHHWKILALDIETYAEKKEIDPYKNPILMIAFSGIDENNAAFQKVITWKTFPHTLPFVEHVKDEAALLHRCREIISSYEPDILTGYFSDGFDLPYLKIRAEKLNVPFALSLDGSPILTTANFRDGESRLKGLLHLDMLKFVKYIFGTNLKTDTYSLDAVASELLGHKKHVVNLDNLANVWNNEPEKLAEFCAYNLHDANLTLQLCQKLLPDMLEFTKLIGLPTNDVIRMRFSRLVENYILKRAMEFNVLAPNKPPRYELEQRMDEHVQGAFVYEPTPGLYENIAVFDFRSLYPSIITAHNIGPEGFRCSCCKSQEEARVPERPEYWFCGKEKKFLPTVLNDIVSRRAEIKKFLKEKKAAGEDAGLLESRSYALKLLANSFYGYLGFFGARWYCKECADATTAYARNYIKSTIGKAREEGFGVIYSDTDSCFLALKEKSLDEALSFMKNINEALPSQMELECEGLYPSGIFVAIKGREKGAKKKYALLSDKGKLKITGFETVRRNWSPIAKEVQEKVLRLVLEKKVDEAVLYVKETVKELKQGKIPLKKVLIRTQISRELSQYSALAPHVAIGWQLRKRGEKIGPGTIIEYIIVKGTGLVRDRARIPGDVLEGHYDHTYYITHQLIPAVASIFAVLGYKEEELFAESSQKGLGSFF